MGKKPNSNKEVRHVKISTWILRVASIAALIWGIIEFIWPISQMQTIIKTDGLPSETVSALVLLLQCCGLGVISVAAFSLYTLSTSFPQCHRGAWFMLLLTATIEWGGESLLSALHGDWVDARLLSIGLIVCWIALLLPIKNFFWHKPA